MRYIVQMQMRIISNFLNQDTQYIYVFKHFEIRLKARLQKSFLSVNELLLTEELKFVIMLSLFSTKVITKQYSFLEKYTKFKSNMMRSLTLEQNFFLANLIRSLEFFTWIKTLLDLLYCTKQFKEFVSNFHRLSYAIVTRGPWHDPFEAALNFSSRQMKEEKNPLLPFRRISFLLPKPCLLLLPYSV